MDMKQTYMDIDKELQLNDVLDFGEYKGLTVEQVIYLDPGYIIAFDHMESPVNISDEVLLLASNEYRNNY